MDDSFEAYTRLTVATRKRINRENRDKDRNELKTVKRPRRVLGEVDINVLPKVNQKSVVRKATRVQGFDLLSFVATQSTSVTGTGKSVSDVISKYTQGGSSYSIVGNSKKYHQLDTTVKCASDVAYVNPQLESCFASITTFLDWFKMSRYDYQVQNNGFTNISTPSTHAMQSIIENTARFSGKPTHEIIQIKPLGKFLRICKVKELISGSEQVVLLFMAYLLELPVQQMICLSDTFATEIKINNSIYKLYLKWKLAE